MRKGGVVHSPTLTPTWLRGQGYRIHVPGWTLEEFLRLAPENQRWEFVHGEVIMNSPASLRHQDIVGFLYSLLRLHCEARAQGRVLAGPAALLVLPQVVREPDVFVLPPGPVEEGPGGLILTRPLFVVEVASPSTRRMDLEDKAQEYAQAGVPEYWVLDPEEPALYQHVLGDEGAYHRHRHTQGWVWSRVLPGFGLQVAWVLPAPQTDLGSAWEALQREARPPSTG